MRFRDAIGRVRALAQASAAAVLLAAVAASGCAPGLFETDGHDSSDGSSSAASSGGSTTSGGTTSGGATTSGSTTGGTTSGGTSGGTTGGSTGGLPAGTPPLGGSSNGSGGGSIAGALVDVPAGYNPAAKTPLLIMYSGTEGASQAMSNLRTLRGRAGVPSHIFVVLDGRSTSASSGAAALDAARQRYNIDNDRTTLLSESAGTEEGLTLGLRTRPAWFAAIWANDPVAVVTPSSNASALGFAPYGSAGAGALEPLDVQDANSIVSAMQAQGYRTTAPYIDPNSGHGTVNGLINGMAFLGSKNR